MTVLYFSGRRRSAILHEGTVTAPPAIKWLNLKDYRPVWFMVNYVTLCLILVVQIEELTLDRKVRQSVTS
jgi:hypothetical protein